MPFKPLFPQTVCAIFFLTAGLQLLHAQAPTHTRHFTPVLDANINGFYEYLPRNYATDLSTSYPLLVFFHGVGESGGSPDDATLDRVLTWGPPRLINNGEFPDSFKVAGQWYKFIVLSPQIISGLDATVTSTISPSTVDAVIEYAKANYRVDPSRIYLCGLSMGGGATWDYAGSSVTAAGKLAAIAVACGAADLSTAEANTIGATNLPVLATQNQGDPTVPVSRTVNNMAQLLAYTPAITPKPIAVYWSSGGHNVWSRTYEDINPGITSQGLSGNLRDTLGMNVYEWMLQFTRVSSTLPLSWQSFTTKEMNGSVLLQWTILQQNNNLSFTVEKSKDGAGWSSIATIPAQQNNASPMQYQYIDALPLQYPVYYRVRQTDLDGKYSYSTVQKISGGIHQPVIRIIPNPIITEAVIWYSGIAQKNILVTLINAEGRMVWRQQYAVSSGNGSVKLDNVKKLAAGMYTTIIETGDGQVLLQTRLLKK